MAIAGAVMLVSLTLAGAECGDPASPPQPMPAPAPGHGNASHGRAPGTASPSWYGWQLLLADAASLTLAIAGNSVATTAGAAAGFTLGAPALHFAHGDRVTAGVSAIARASMVGAIANIAANSDPDCHDDRCKRTLQDDASEVMFLALGAVFVLVDDTLLSFATAGPAFATAGPAGPGAEPTRGAPSFAFTPAVAPTVGGISMGLAGRF